jgi:hypothetical protein
MDDRSAAFGRAADLLRQARKVSRQNRRCEFDQTWALGKGMLQKFYHADRG